MATFAPCSAKRTAIACPIPDVPPVTRTFLPLSPRMPSRAAVDSIMVIAASPFVGRSAGQPDEVSVRPLDEPEAAEPEHVLAQHLPRLAVADVVVERPPAVGQLPPAVAPPGRPQEVALRAGSCPEPAGHDVGRPRRRTCAVARRGP